MSDEIPIYSSRALMFQEVMSNEVDATKTGFLPD